MSSAAESRPSSTPSLLSLAYGQIAAMVGAFSLLVFLTNFFDLGLKGMVHQAFEGWTQYVRPIVGYPLAKLIALLPEAWRFHVPEVVKDYFSVGLVAALSLLRADAMTPPRMSIKGRAASFVLTTILWPAFLTGFIEGTWEGAHDAGRGYRRVTLFTTLVLAPLIYLGLLFAANAWLP